jgi:flagellar basal body-associated protein FliL
MEMTEENQVRIKAGRTNRVEVLLVVVVFLLLGAMFVALFIASAMSIQSYNDGLKLFPELVTTPRP